MALMLGHLYQALRAAGVPESLAREAAEEVAQHRLGLARQRALLRLVQVAWTITGLAGLLMVWDLLR